MSAAALRVDWRPGFRRRAHKLVRVAHRRRGSREAEALSQTARRHPDVAERLYRPAPPKADVVNEDGVAKAGMSSSVMAAETLALPIQRLPIAAYAPIDAPLAMPIQPLESVFETWLRSLRSNIERAAKPKQKRQAGAGVG